MANFKICKSSAGAGKTYTLVKEYLLIALDGDYNFRNILAISFTNKASAEMRNRIIETLKILADPLLQKAASIEDLGTELCQKLKIDKKALATRAQRCLSHILHHYSEFAVSTIDSFVQRIIKSFAQDLNLPYNYSLHLDFLELKNEAINQLLSEINKESESFPLFLDYIFNQTESEKSWNIKQSLLELSKILSSEESQHFIQKLRGISPKEYLKCEKSLQIYCKDYEQSISQKASKALSILEGMDHEHFYFTSKGVLVFFTKLAKKESLDLQGNSYIRKAWILENRIIKGKTPSNEQECRILELEPQLRRIYQDLQDFKQTEEPRYYLYKLLRKNLIQSAILNEIEKKIIDISEQEGLLPIHRSNRLISKIVQEEAIPYIYEKLGNRYHYFLIDEFQDTSALQWINLIPLIENSLSENHFDMVVGDAKQAIYRFREGKAEQFVALPKIYDKPDIPHFDQKEKILIDNYTEEHLDTNYRSCKEIIEFNNSLFGFLKKELAEEESSVYQNHEQKSIDTKTGGYIKLEVLDKLNTRNTKDIAQWHIDKCIDNIESIIKDNYQYEDIVILARNNKDLQKIAQSLLAKQIPIITSESLILSSSPAVKLIIAWMQWVFNNQNDLAKIEIIYLMNALDLLNSTEKKELKKGGLKTIFANLSINSFPCLNLNQIGRKLAKLSLYELFEELMLAFFPDKGHDAFLQGLGDSIIEFSLKKPGLLSLFLSYWEEIASKKSIILPQNMNAIRLMSIHKSKGLQFPIVILPFIKDDKRMGKENFFIHHTSKDLNIENFILQNKTDLEFTEYGDIYQNEKNKSFLDRLNLFYVACTRAVERLYILADYSPVEKLKDLASFVMDYGKNMDEISQNQDSREAKISHCFSKGLALPRINGTQKGDQNNNYYFNSSSCKPHRANYTFAKNTIPQSLKTGKHKQYLGNHFHNFMCQIDNFSHLEDKLSQYIHKENLSLETENELAQLLLQINKESRIVDLLFSNVDKVYNENSLILENGNMLRPDRFMIKGDKCILIDYKTGRKNRRI